MHDTFLQSSVSIKSVRELNMCCVFAHALWFVCLSVCGLSHSDDGVSIFRKINDGVWHHWAPFAPVYLGVCPWT